MVLAASRKTAGPWDRTGKGRAFWVVGEQQVTCDCNQIEEDQMRTRAAAGLGCGAWGAGTGPATWMVSRRE